MVKMGGGIEGDEGKEDYDAAEIIFQKREREKEISFRLKEQITDQIDRLLEKGEAGAWLDILAWYQILKGKCLIIDKFWEFPVLDTMLKAFQEEWKMYYSEGRPVTVLSLRSMKELTDSYFMIVFILRRIEYDVDPKDELLDCLLEKKLSLAVVEIILADAGIYDKKKVKKVLDGRGGNESE